MLLFSVSVVTVPPPSVASSAPPGIPSSAPVSTLWTLVNIFLHSLILNLLTCFRNLKLDVYTAGDSCWTTAPRIPCASTGFWSPAAPELLRAPTRTAATVWIWTRWVTRSLSKILNLIYYQPQGKVMFSEASACSQMGRGVGQTPFVGITPPPRHPTGMHSCVVHWVPLRTSLVTLSTCLQRSISLASFCTLQAEPSVIMIAKTNLKYGRTFPLKRTHQWRHIW